MEEYSKKRVRDGKTDLWQQLLYLYDENSKRSLKMILGVMIIVCM